MKTEISLAAFFTFLILEKEKIEYVIRYLLGAKKGSDYVNIQLFKVDYNAPNPYNNIYSSLP